MTWFRKIFKGDQPEERVDYYREGLELMKVGRYHDALTSLRLAQREAPNDNAVLLQIAIAHTRIGMTDEAIRNYRTILLREPGAEGAHYGLAFLLLQGGRQDEAVKHLRAFLAHPPEGVEAERHVEHARETLAELGVEEG